MELLDVAGLKGEGEWAAGALLEALPPALPPAGAAAAASTAVTGAHADRDADSNFVKIVL